VAKILIVDDSLSIQKLVTFALSSEKSYELTTASDGQEALGHAKAGQFDLVITDINMPIMGGIELIQNLRTLPAYAVTPIVCLTTESSKEKMGSGKNAGASAWMVKPFQPAKLLKVIAKLL
jgi:two-component system, chemotaxis family, chemotaxis protein CheY